jgi:hypothetical protein
MVTAETSAMFAETAAPTTTQTIILCIHHFFWVEAFVAFCYVSFVSRHPPQTASLSSTGTNPFTTISIKLPSCVLQRIGII